MNQQKTISVRQTKAAETDHERACSRHKTRPTSPWRLQKPRLHMVQVASDG